MHVEIDLVILVWDCLRCKENNMGILRGFVSNILDEILLVDKDQTPLFQDGFDNDKK